MKPTSRRLAALAALLLAPGLSAPAQSTQQPTLEGATPITRDLLDASKFLGPEYKKEADGFRLSPPAGSRIIQRAGVDLVSYIVDAKSWAGSLQLLTKDKPTSLDDMVARTKTDITTGGVFKGAQVLDDTRLKHESKYSAARLSFSMEAAFNKPARGSTAAVQPAQNQSITLFRQEFLVQVKETQFMALTLDAPLKDRAEATQTFAAMISEFEIFNPVLLRQKRIDAIKAAKEWIVQRSADELRTKLIKEAQYFRIMIVGKDVGYIRFDELTQEAGPNGTGLIDVQRDGHKGVLELVNFRSFTDDAVSYGQNEAFWSFSKDAKGGQAPDASTWHNISKTKTRIVIPPDKLKPGENPVRQVMPWLEETGVLSQIGVAARGPQSDMPYQIVVTLNGDSGQPMQNGVNTRIPVDEAHPLPKILEYTWTRLVDLSKPTEMSFIVFDSFSKKLGLRNLVVTGKKESVLIDGRSESCFKCIDEVDPNSTTLWVDATGRIRMMKTNDHTIMIPTTEAAMAAKWAKRLADQ